MEYKGKIYGKIGNKYFDTGKNTEYWNEMVKALEFNLKVLERIHKPIFSQRLAITQTKEAIEKAIG